MSKLDLLREAERSSVSSDPLEDLDHEKELWIIRVPRDVSFCLATGLYACACGLFPASFS